MILVEKTITQILPVVDVSWHVCQCAFEHNGRVFRASGVGTAIEVAMRNAEDNARNLALSAQGQSAPQVEAATAPPLIENRHAAQGGNGQHAPKKPMSEAQRKAIYAECKNRGLDPDTLAMSRFGCAYGSLSAQQAYFIIREFRGEGACPPMM